MWKIETYFLGFVHAQDRLWQMEVQRRVAKGTVSELVGSDGLETDKISRTFGFERIAKQDWELLSAETKGYVNAYVAGCRCVFSHKRFDI